jgi:hypothetical protein
MVRKAVTARTGRWNRPSAANRNVAAHDSVTGDSSRAATPMTGSAVRT